MCSIRPALDVSPPANSAISHAGRREGPTCASGENYPSAGVLVACGALVPVALGASAALDSTLFGALAVAASVGGSYDMVREGARLARAGQVHEATKLVADKGLEMGRQVAGAMLLSGVCAASAVAILATAPLTWIPCAAAGVVASANIRRAAAGSGHPTAT